MEKENEIIQAIIKEISDIDGCFEREIEVNHSDSITYLNIWGRIEFTNAFPGTYDLPSDKGTREVTLYIDDVMSFEIFEIGEEINLNLNLNYIINEVKKSL